jgi:hypothetical protein
MNSGFIYTNMVRIILFLMIQILLLNTLPLGRFYIMIYPVVILLLPIAVPRALVVIISFVCGFILDWFSNGNGLHTASLTFLGYARGHILPYFRPKSGWDKLDVPNIYQQGLNWFVYYTAIAVLLHHSAYFFLEAFSTINILYTIQKLLLSAAASFSVILLVNLLFLRNRKM